MNLGFWEKIEKPIMALAPMADVTDDAFRQMFTRYGKPAVMFTEFVSTDGLTSAGRKNLMRELQFTEDQRPIVAQIWGNKPESFFKAAQFIASLGFDGIDINFGCPQKKEMQQGTCAALIDKPELALKIIEATKKGAVTLPVSVKTRLGVKNINTESWVSTLLKSQIAAITLHARTAKEMSAVPAHWEEIRKAVRLKDKFGSETLILGNGDIRSLQEAGERVKQTGADGIMVGRGVFGKPWFFAKELTSLEEKLSIMVEHAELFEKVFNPPKNFAIMRKHFKAYCAGFPGASDLRARLMQAENAATIKEIALKFLPLKIKGGKEGL